MPAWGSVSRCPSSPAVTAKASNSRASCANIERNLHGIKNADWIIDMGPEGGSKGGKVMFEGTPKELLKAKHSITRAYLH